MLHTLPVFTVTFIFPLQFYVCLLPHRVKEFIYSHLLISELHKHIIILLNWIAAFHVVSFCLLCNSLY